MKIIIRAFVIFGEILLIFSCDSDSTCENEMFLLFAFFVKVLQQVFEEYLVEYVNVHALVNVLKIFPHKFSIFTFKIYYLDKTRFRGCNPEVQTLLKTPISMASVKYGVYGNYGHITIMSILGIWP